MNKNLLQIYKLYNIETFYHLQKLKNNLALISQNISCLKDKLKSYKYVYILENDIIFDISQHIIYKCLKNYNFDKINQQQNNKYMNAIEIQTLNNEYYFKDTINFSSPLYLKIVEVMNNNFHFVFILHPSDNIPIGIAKITGTKKGIESISVLENDDPSVFFTDKIHSSLQNCVKQLEEYFKGERIGFDLLVNPKELATGKSALIKFWAKRCALSNTRC